MKALSHVWLELVILAGAALVIGAVQMRRRMQSRRRHRAAHGVAEPSAQAASHARRRVMACVLLALLSLAAVAPVLLDGRMSIHDCANVYRSFPSINWLQPSTFLNIDNDPHSARPGEVFVYLPALFGTSALAHYWYQSGLVLVATVALLCLLLCRMTGRVWLPFIGAAALLLSAPFTENYYTIGKCEPFMLAGAVGVVYVLHRLLTMEAAAGWALLWLAPLGVLSALMATTVKETAGAFFVAYAAGWPLAIWAADVKWRVALRRTWWLSLAVTAGFSVLVWQFLHLPEYYDQGGAATYSLMPLNLLSGMRRVGGYYLATTAYVAPALLAAVVVAIRVIRDYRLSAYRSRIGWTAYMGVMFAGFAGVYVPWSDIQARYMLPGTAAAIAFTVLCIDLGVSATKRRGGRRFRAVVWGCSAAALLLLAAQSAFTLLVGPLSEGMARQRLDQAYDEMFRYVAAHTPPGGTAYFMYDVTHGESRYNTGFGMPLFYGRPDVTCIFPSNACMVTTPGLIAVADSSTPYNPNRMPLHASARETFLSGIASTMRLSEVKSIVYETRVWYTDALAYRGFQHAAVWGVPAFWKLTRGAYRFGWSVYAYSPEGEAPDLVENGMFRERLRHWSHWGAATDNPAMVEVTNGALRVTDPSGKLSGVKQHLAVAAVSGAVYRLSASARSVGRPDGTRMMGGRVAFHLPPQPEAEIAWISQRDVWVNKSIVFTNTVNGQGMVIVHMGYGNAPGTVEFTNVKLELLQ